MFSVFSGQNLNHADAWWALNADYIHHNHTDHFYDLIHMYPVYKVSILGVVALWGDLKDIPTYQII